MKSRPLQFIHNSVVALLVSLPVLQNVQPAMAQVRFNPPKVGAPGNREAGAARSDQCVTTVDHKGLTAILPTGNIGLTAKAFPTFFVYVPPNNAELAEFRIYEKESEQDIYNGQVQLPKADNPKTGYRNQAAVVSVTLPNQGSPGLEAGKHYVWAFLLVCNNQNRASDIVTVSEVQRIDQTYLKTLDPALQQKLKNVGQLPGTEQLSIYGSAGLWHDLLAEAIVLMGNTSMSDRTNWAELLTDQGLGTIANAPIFKGTVVPITP